MVREPTVGVPDGASAEWDMADYAAVGRDEPLKEASAPPTLKLANHAQNKNASMRCASGDLL